MNNKTEYLKPSSIGAEYATYIEALAQVKGMPINASLRIEPGLLDIHVIREVLATKKRRRFVAIDHGAGGIEVRRLVDDADIKLFYKLAGITPRIIKPIKLCDYQYEKIVQRVIDDFFHRDDEHILAYDCHGLKLRAAGCIGASYIQRRTAGMAAFRLAGKEALAETLERMVKRGAITRLSKIETIEIINGSARAYRVNTNFKG